MPPVAAEIGKHAGKVAHRSNAWSRERCAGVSVTPSGAAISRLENEVGVVVGETTAAFVHTRDVYCPAAGSVARDLCVAHKSSLSAHHHRAAPGGPRVSRTNDEDVCVCSIKVVPGNVQSPKEWRTRIVISPARFAVRRALVESAEMGPAIRVLGSCGLISAQALTAAGAIQPDRNPSAGRLVVENNRVAKGVVEGALAIGLRKAGKGSAAIGGNRCAGNVDGVKVAAA